MGQLVLLSLFVSVNNRGLGNMKKMEKDEIANASFGLAKGLAKSVEFHDAVSLLTTSLGLVLSAVPDCDNVTKIKNEISNFIAKEIIHDSDKKNIFQVIVIDNGNDASVLAFPRKGDRAPTQ